MMKLGRYREIDSQSPVLMSAVLGKSDEVSQL